VPTGLTLAGACSATRRIAVSLLSGATLALVAVLPSAPASASATSGASLGGASPIIVPGSATPLSGSSLQALLAGAHLGPSTPTIPAVSLETLEVPKLAHLLAGLTPIDQLAGLSLLGLPPTTLGAAGLESALQHAIEKAVAAGDTLGQLLSAKGLSPYLGESLTSALGTAVEPAVTLLLKRSVEEVLAEGLATTSVAQLTSSLLGGATHPTALGEALVRSFDAATVQSHAGSLPAAAPVQSLTLEELASQLSLTPHALAEQLGQTPSTLPASTPVTLSQLQDGNELALLRSVGGLTAGVLTPLEEVTEPIKETVEEKVVKPVEETIKGVTGEIEGLAGKAGGAGGGTTTITNVSGAPGQTTVVVGSAAPAPPLAGSSPTAKTTGKIKLISRRVRGAVATLVLSVPSSGRLNVSGSHMRPVARNLLRSQRVTVRIGLSSARAKVLRAHPHRSLKVALRASFAPTSGSRSSLATRVVLR
jgi:hypothetical protein